MELSEKQKHSLHFFLKDQSEEYLNKIGVQKCKNCKSTGLAGFGGTYNDYFWDMSYCEECNGVGYVNIPKSIPLTDETFLCPKCYGGHKYYKPISMLTYCSYCNDTGVIDWVTNIMRKK